MITDTLLLGLKDLFHTLGAKTSDSNYAVGLYDKTSGEPKGMMGMSDLSSVLGVKKWKRASGNNGGVATITTQRIDSILFVRNEVNGNGYGIIYGQTMEGMNYYNLSRSGNTVTLTPTEVLSGYVEYIEW